VAKVAAEVGSTANRYQILGKLAVGGMAEIFLARGAHATGMERYCVLKRILRERATDAEFVQMFLDEARLAAQLQHPNIASVYDIGMLGDSYFFTMEYVHGETVRSLLQRALGLQRQVPLACVLTIIAGAASGLHHAHERMSNEGRPLGIVHRDVTPSNLMVSYEGNVKVVDFGVAKAADRAVETRSGTVKGKISYLSPEQCRGARVDRRSDLFSLGIVMWEMLTGTRLYRRTSDFENMTAIVNEPPPPPSKRRAEVPRAVDDIVLRLLAKSVTDRFQTASEVVEAIENASMRAGTMLSSSALSRLIRDLFGTRAEPWLVLDGDTQSFQRLMLATRPLPRELGGVALDPIEAELAAVPDLSVSLVFEDSFGDGSTSAEHDMIEPRAPAASPATPAVRAAGSIAPPFDAGSPARPRPPVPAASRPPPPVPVPVPASPPRGVPAIPVSQQIGGAAAPSPGSAPVAVPGQPAPAGAGPSDLLRALAGLPRDPNMHTSAGTLLGVSAPTPASTTAALAAIRAHAGAVPPGPNTTVRDLASPFAVAAHAPAPVPASPSAVTAPDAAKLPPIQASPPQGAPWPPVNPPPAQVEPRPRLASQPVPNTPTEFPTQHSGPSRAPFAAPGFAHNPAAFAGTTAPTTEYRRPEKRASRFTPRLITVMVLAAAIGAVAAWLAMRGDHRPPPSPGVHVDPGAVLSDAGAPATAPAIEADAAAAPSPSPPPAVPAAEPAPPGPAAGAIDPPAAPEPTRAGDDAVKVTK